MEDDDTKQRGPQRPAPGRDLPSPADWNAKRQAPSEARQAAQPLLPVSLPSISAPKGGGALRSIGETFRANTVTGTGSLAVPLPLSPSRAGSGPKLALSYDSGQGQGPFGAGWSVDLPSITRRTDKGLPQYRDPDESDEFVLSGAEVLVPALVQKGTTWERDAFDDPAYHVVRYRPRVESAFARIERRTDRATGEVHWRTTTKDNVTSIFGKSASARLADPSYPRWKVFCWLLEATFDDRGNVTWFEYKPEDTASLPYGRVEEKTRRADANSFANRYVKRIHYGNRAAFTGTDPSIEDLQALAWSFEVVFDYGEHDATIPTPDEVQPWLCRQDPFSTFRARFDVRTYRLCQRILMFHRFDELGPEPVLVRSLDLIYEPSPVTTYLRSITETGWQRTGAGYTTASMPRLDLDYTRADLKTTVQALDRESVVHLPGGVDGTRARFVDLDGEGIPGVLAQQGGGLYYKRNDGGGHFTHARALPRVPNVAGAPGQALMSLEGDGKLDMVLLGRTVRGRFKREGDGWRPFWPFVRCPNVDLGDPNVRLLDVDGDGLVDVMFSDSQAFAWSRSLRGDGFDRPRVVQKFSDEERGPNFAFATPTHAIFLADMTGDGMMDIVRVRNGEICYWPNLGYGHFGAKITMGKAPCFDRPDAFDARRIRFGDIDGSGTSDIAYVRPDGVAIYLNQAGNRWSDPVLVRGLPGRRDTSIELVDLLGTGTACLVWSSQAPADAQRPVRYVDLLESTKPHLLNCVTNNLGLETRIAYAPSTRFYLEDRAAGSPWVTRLPFPVQVVARVETADAVQKTRLLTTYRYKHGYFDGYEREFRGFGRVDQWDAESYSDAHGQGLLPPGLNEQNGAFLLPPVHTKTWFDTGAWREAQDLYAQYRREQYGLDPAAPPLADPIRLGGLGVVESREEARARRGMPLRREVYAEDITAAAVHPYVVEEHRYQARLLQPMTDQRHPVFFTHEHESVTRHYERSPADPRVEHAFTLEVDDFGNVLRSAHVAYPRRVPEEPEQGVLLATCAEASFVNETEAFHRLGVPIEARTYELTGLAAPASGIFALSDVDGATTSASPIPFDATPTPGTVQKRLLSQRRTLYLREDLTGPLPLGSIASQALVYEAYAKSMPASLAASTFAGMAAPAVLTAEGGYVNLDADWWRPSGRPTYDPARFYQATAVTDPFGNTARVVLDAYALLPIEAHTSDDTTVDNVTLATNDYRVLQPGLVTDPNGNQTALSFDALGMVIATAVMGKPGLGEGDTLADPTTRIEYDLLAWQHKQGPAYVHTYAREKHGAANPRWQESYTYSDGSGHEVMRKVQAAPEPNSTAPRWVGTGRTVFDNKGNPVKKYEPYFSPSPAYEDEPSIVMQGVTAILRYDPLSRHVRTDFPNGTFETVTFDAWTETRADANDNVLESEWYEANEALPVGDPRRSAADAAAKHAHTPSVRRVDPLGRTFLVIEDNGPLGKYATRTALDVQGNTVAVTDARGIVVLTQSFDLEQRVLASTSVDAGARKSLQDVAGNAIRAVDSRPFLVRTEYDALRRPLRVYVTPPNEGEMLAERLVYGEAAAGGGAAQNLRGRKVLHYDGAGELSLSAYDFQGNLTTTTRRLAVTYHKAPDWKPLALLTDAGSIQSQAAALLEADAFTTTTSYDALNRVISTVTPGPTPSTFLPSYDEASLLKRVGVQIRGAAATTFVEDIQYNAKGQREQIVYGDDGQGNGTITTAYTYEDLTFRLAQLKTTRASDGELLQNLFYTYDPVANVTQVQDSAHQKVFFANDVVLPVAAYTYDALYRLLQANGREQSGGNADVQRDWQDIPLMNLPHPNDVAAVRNYTESYDYDEVGNITRMGHDTGLAATSWTRGYRYESDPSDPTRKPISNRLASTSAPGDGPGTYSTTYGYDASGNMTSMPHLPTITWTFRNEMASADKDGGGIVYFTYDAGGQRVRKVWEHNGLVEERVYVGGFEVYRKRAAGASNVLLARETLHAMDGEKRVALVETTTADASAGGAFQVATVTRFQLGNHLGSAVLEVDQGGMVISYEEYHPYGTTSYHSGTGAAEVSLKRYRYTGKERDEETGLNYHGARYFAPWLARWMSADPAGMAEGPSAYVYCANRPIIYQDRNGKEKTASEVLYETYLFHRELLVKAQAAGAPPEVLRGIAEAGEAFKRAAIQGSGGQSGVPVAAAFGGSAAFPALKPPAVQSDAPKSIRPLMELSNQAVPQVQAATARGLQGGALIAMTLVGAAAGGAVAVGGGGIGAGVPKGALFARTGPTVGAVVAASQTPQGRQLLQGAAAEGQVIASEVQAIAQTEAPVIASEAQAVAQSEAPAVAQEAQAVVQQTRATSERLLELAIERGPENISGFRLYGEKGLSGNVFERNVLLVEAETKGALGQLRQLFTALESEARASGAQVIRITGYSTYNKGFLSPAVARRFGYAFTQIDAETGQFTKNLGQ